LSLIASGADVSGASGVSANEDSHSTLPLSLLVAMMRGGLSADRGLPDHRIVFISHMEGRKVGRDDG